MAATPTAAGPLRSFERFLWPSNLRTRVYPGATSLRSNATLAALGGKWALAPNSKAALGERGFGHQAAVANHVGAQDRRKATLATIQGHGRG